MCPSKPKVKDPPPIPDPAPPLEKTATSFERDTGSKNKKQKSSGDAGASRTTASDLRVDLAIPNAGAPGLQV